MTANIFLHNELLKWDYNAIKRFGDFLQEMQPDIPVVIQFSDTDVYISQN